MIIKCTQRILNILLLSLSLCSCSNLSAQQNQTLPWTLNDYLNPQAADSTWAMMSKRFRFTQQYQQPAVVQQRRWFKRHGKYFTLLTTNAKPYVYYIYQQALQRHMPPEVALLPMVESNYNPFLFSRQGATGLWQIMPGTASGFGLKIDWWYDGRRDIVASTDAALNYLTYLHGFFHDDWLLAIAAYNAGEGTVQQAIRYNKRHHKPTDYWHLALPEETKYYLPKLLAAASIIYNQSHDRIKITPVSYQPYFSDIPLKGEYNLKLLASYAKIPMKTLRKLNPGFRRFTSGPHFTYHLLIPADKERLFKAQLANLKNHPMVWEHHRVVSGDNLISLAHRFHTKPSIIKQVNHLPSNALHINQSLLIPETDHHFVNLSEQNASVSEDHVPGPERIIHTVKPNDSLWSIAKLYHIRPRDIEFWNNLKSYHLKVNQRLLIWKRHITTKKSYFIHTVRKGDSLSLLAKRFATSERLIKLYNDMHHSQLKIGEKLRIPRHHKAHYTPKFDNQMVIHYVKPGDSISSLAKYYRVPKSTLIQQNHLKASQLLMLGQPIQIYFSK